MNNKRRRKLQNEKKNQKILTFVHDIPIYVNVKLLLKLKYYILFWMFRVRDLIITFQITILTKQLLNGFKCYNHITKSILRKTTRAQKILMGLDLGLRFGV